MDYTKNYHLPQWVDDDLIRRTDFNDAMAGIETGLTDARTHRDSIVESLRRAAYNNWHQLSSLAIAPWQDGALRQDFLTTGRDVGCVSPDGTGTLFLYDGRWFANCAQAGSASQVKASARQLSTISYAKKSKLYSATFTPPYPVLLQRVYAYGWFKREMDGLKYTQTQEGGWSGRLYNDITGELLKEVVYTKNLFEITAGEGYFDFDIWLAVPLHQNVRYRYELELRIAPVIPCEFGLGLSQTDLSGNPVNAFSCRGAQQESASFSGKLRLIRPASEGIALARYGTYGAGGGVELEWQGKTLTPHTVRTVDYKGQTVQEAEFRLKGPIPAESTLKLTAHCGADGEFILYDWGAAVI